MLGDIIKGVGKAFDSIAGIIPGNTNQREQQREFAQKGVQWRVKDAEAAGIHPLAALGANLTNYSPVTVGTDFAGVGQDISNAMHKTRSQPERDEAVKKSMADLGVTNLDLQNQLLKSQIAKINASINPPMPNAGTRHFIPGQGNSPTTDDLGEKAERPQRQMHLRTPDGYIPTDPNLSDAQSIEDRWGEWVGDIYGVRNWWHEAGRHMYSKWRKSHDDWWESEKRR